MSQVSVVCPNPACKGRSVQNGEVLREEWEATWVEPTQFDHPQHWANDIYCPRCPEEGIDPESGQLDSAEEELGERCSECGVVNSLERRARQALRRVPVCEYCGYPMPFVGSA